MVDFEHLNKTFMQMEKTVRVGLGTTQVNKSPAEVESTGQNLPTCLLDLRARRNLRYQICLNPALNFSTANLITNSEPNTVLIAHPLL